MIYTWTIILQASLFLIIYEQKAMVHVEQHEPIQLYFPVH